MKNLASALQRVLDSPAYMEWSRSSNGYLSSFFRIIGENEAEDWQIDFYDRKSDTLTSFMASDTPRILQSGSKIFKPAHEKVKELNLKNVKLGLPDALLIVEKLVHTEYQGEKPSKKIVILQNTDRELWNITYLTSTFNIINVKVDARNGKILHQEIKSALSYR